MKSPFKVTALLCLLLAIYIPSQAQQYAEKAGYIEYKLSGNTTGTKTLYWNNYGNKSHTETKAITKTSLFGIVSETEEHTVTIVNGKTIYSANLITQTGTKTINPYYDAAHDLTKDLTEAQYKQLEKDLLNAFGGEKLGIESVLGKNCKVISIMGSKIWVFKGLSLKSETNVMGMQNIEAAIKIDFNASIPSSKFEPLAQINYTDISTTQQQMYGEAFALDLESNDSESRDASIYPVNYPFDKFKQIVSTSQIAGYSRGPISSVEGQHAAIFMQGFINTITIVATSQKNADNEDTSTYETFSHKGKTCHYGTTEDEGTALIIEYPKNDMFIVIAASLNKSKNELLLISDKLAF